MSSLYCQKDKRQKFYHVALADLAAFENSPAARKSSMERKITNERKTRNTSSRIFLAFFIILETNRMVFICVIPANKINFHAKKQNCLQLYLFAEAPIWLRKK